MKKRYTEEQIIGFPCGRPMPDCRSGAVQEAWLQRAELLRMKAKFGSMKVSDAQRLKALEAENTKLKKLLANSMLEIDAMREVLKEIDGRGGASRGGAQLQERFERDDRPEAGGHEPSTLRYRPRDDGNDHCARAPDGTASQHRRHGYRMLHSRLRIDGWAINVKRTYRVYREEGLMVRKRRRKKLPVPRAATLVRPMQPDEVCGAWTSCSTSWPTAGGSRR